jgi:hypothetical protein
MRASGRLRTIKPWIYRDFSRLLTSFWMLLEVFGRGEMVGRVATTFQMQLIDL